MSALHPLRPEQRDASDPAAHAWVSASAGTGKTQVLTARVLRLLLDGADPGRILCLTFTKAAAAEMQTRIYATLARWVRADDDALARDLAALGAEDADHGAARQLFTRTLETRGGLRIQTLHAFAQSLLASFPLEAGVAPGFAALDDRTAIETRARVLTDALEEARETGDDAFVADIADLAIRHGEQRLSELVTVLLRYRAGLASLPEPHGIEPLIRREMGLATEGEPDALLAAMLSDEAFDCATLKAFGHACIDWGAATGEAHAGVIFAWLGLDGAGRLRSFGELRTVFVKADGAPRALSAKMAANAPLAERLFDAVKAVSDMAARFAVASLAARHLRVGRRLAESYDAHKRRVGALAFDDMIARAAAMLTRPGMADWVRYKLDQRIDHILVDEGQDTNGDQWRIVHALSQEFFAGEGARDERRTLFAVGDFKQAIFRFQGSRPEIFLNYQNEFRLLAEDAAATFRDVPLSESFRSTDAILDVVNRVIDDVGHAALGLEEAPPAHRPAERLAGLAGQVTLWPAVVDPAKGGDGADPSEQDWIAESETLMAQRLARQIGAWMRDPPLLATKGRPMRPEDILVLVRKRRAFVGALVAALHAERVPVAGVDRLRLTEPIAVQDLLALARFAVQPEDDLTLAAILTSPLIGWDQQALFDAAFDRGRQSLWRRIREREGDDPRCAAAAAWLRDALAIADLKAPYEFFETVLSGPLQGRSRLLSRLGEEAREGIDAVLAQALAFEAGHAPSLQGFLAWVENDDIELKRDPEAPLDAVRIMTVHGAKGLQAPVVILADAARTSKGRARAHAEHMLAIGGETIPLFFGGRDGRVGPVDLALAEEEEAESAENLRLLYVALTRAEEMLFVGGSLGKREEAPGDDSWHAIVRRALEGRGAGAEPNEVWRGEVLTYARGERHAARPASQAAAATAVAVPDWARTSPHAEESPPRPLSPSQIAADDVAQPPPGAAMAEAARRGQLLHALFERLPDASPERRDAAARSWLARQAPDLDEAERAAIADQALTIIGEPAFAALFGPAALAEAPVAALVGRTVIAGTVDRLLVEDDRVQVVDFKTGSRVPARAEEAEPYHLAQMASYVAALERVFPGRRIEAALLYTRAAKLVLLPPEIIDAHRPVERIAAPT